MLRISRGSVKLKLKLIYIYKYTHACFYTFSYSEWSCMLINPIDNCPSKFLQAFRGMWEIVLVSRVAILKAMLDLDALTWRLWKLGMPRVHCLDGSYEERSYSICFPNHQCSLLFGEIIWRLSKAFVMCILLLCWTYSTDEDFNTPVVLQKSMVCDLNIRLAFGVIGHPAGHIACRNSNGWNTLQEKPIWLLSWLRPCTLAESLTSFTMNNPNIGSRTTWT